MLKCVNSKVNRSREKSTKSHAKSVINGHCHLLTMSSGFFLLVVSGIMSKSACSNQTFFYHCSQWEEVGAKESARCSQVLAVTVLVISGTQCISHKSFIFIPEY